MWGGVVILCEYLPETTIGIQFAEHLGSGELGYRLIDLGGVDGLLGGHFRLGV